MSVETLQVYPDLFDSSIQKDIPIIEERARRVGHLSPDEGLLERIRTDLTVLEQYGLNKQDIYNNHRNMYMVSHTYGKKVQTGKTIKLNGQNLKIRVVVWKGAEQCPIRTFFNKGYYAGGDRDWYVTNIDTGKTIRVGNLLPTQANMFGFFQSPSSDYRLDPKEYIEIFGITGHIDLLPTITKRKWGSGSARSSPYESNSHIAQTEFISKMDDNDITFRISNDNYTVTVGTLKHPEWTYLHKTFPASEKYMLVIYFNNEVWIKQNVGKSIVIDGHKLFIDEYTDCRSVYTHTIREFTVLDKDAINYDDS